MAAKAKDATLAACQPPNDSLNNYTEIKINKHNGTKTNKHSVNKLLVSKLTIKNKKKTTEQVFVNHEVIN